MEPFYGRTPLHLAAVYGHIETVQKLFWLWRSVVDSSSNSIESNLNGDLAWTWYSDNKEIYRNHDNPFVIPDKVGFVFCPCATRTAD